MKCTIDLRNDSLQGRIFKFLGKEGKGNIAKVFGEGSITASNTKRIKNSAKLFGLLKTVPGMFKKHGMFMHKGDRVIQGINLRFFENLLDPKRLIMRINDKSGFSVISTKKFQGDYWLRTTDATFAKENSQAVNDARQARITKQNLAEIEKVNAHFRKIVGQDGIVVTKVGRGHKLTFDQNVLNEFNGHSYSNYVKSMTRYISREEPTVNDFFEQSPI